MVNIWEYYIGDPVEISDIYGNRRIGVVECQIGEDEMEDELDFISIISFGKQYGYNIDELRFIKKPEEQICANGFPYDYMLSIFEKGEGVDETTFFFASEGRKGENHYLGYLPDGPHPEKPYWAGYCDIENGFDAATAEELFEAPIYRGKSLKDRWSEVYICEIGGMPAPDW